MRIARFVNPLGQMTFGVIDGDGERSGWTVEAIDGSSVGVRAASLCVHGDSPGAVEMATRVKAALQESGVEIAPFVGGSA